VIHMRRGLMINLAAAIGMCQQVLARLRLSDVNRLSPLYSLLDQLADLEEGATPHELLRTTRKKGRPPPSRNLTLRKASCIVAWDWLHEACRKSPAEADKYVVERANAVMSVTKKTLTEWRKPGSRKRLQRDIEPLAGMLKAMTHMLVRPDDQTVKATLDRFFALSSVSP
jgi:hypothetical protein